MTRETLKLTCYELALKAKGLTSKIAPVAEATGYKEESVDHRPALEIAKEIYEWVSGEREAKEMNKECFPGADANEPLDSFFNKGKAIAIDKNK